jgi:gamma-glutamyl-gamma-aminobutyraldehyde dehydrogenase
VLKRIQLAQEQGAQMMLGGQATAPNAAGAYLAPTLFIDATQKMAIVQEETFGPVTSLQAFNTEEEAIRLANDSIYGLAASVWTADLKTAHRMVGALQAGVVWVNCFGDGDMTQPFGGYKQSGNSRDKYKDCLLSYMQTKSAWFNLA